MRTLALALLFCVPACSGDDEDTDTGATTNTASTTSPTTSATTTMTAGTNAGTTDGTTGTDTDAMTSTEGTTAGTTDGTTAGTTTAGTTETTTDGTGTTTDDPTTTTDPTDGTTTTGGGDDPNWPPPDLMNMMMPCPDNTVPASFVMGGIVCSPECTGVNNLCPEAESGTAAPACVFNPESSGAMCMMGEMCEDPEEMCQMTGGGGMACLKPSSHCVLLCNQGQTCPDGMMCFGNLVCQYPAG